MDNNKIICKSKNNNMSNIQEVGNYVKELKYKHKKTTNRLNKYLEENTKDEVEELEKAMRNLNKKVDSLKETDYYLNMEKKLESYEEKIQITMTNVLIYYKKAIKRIFKEYPDESEKKHKLLKFHNSLEEAFLTEDEKKIIKTIKTEIKQIPHKIVSIPI